MVVDEVVWWWMGLGFTDFTAFCFDVSLVLAMGALTEGWKIL
jgi:hypothetical protein